APPRPRRVKPSPPPDVFLALPPPAHKKKLARYLRRCLVALETATDEQHMIDVVRRVRDKVVGQFFGHPRGEETGMRVFEVVQLSADRCIHSRMRMAEAGHGGAAGRVDVVLAVRIADENSLPARRDRIVVTDLPMKDVRHDRPEPFRRGKM